MKTPFVVTSPSDEAATQSRGSSSPLPSPLSSPLPSPLSTSPTTPPTTTPTGSTGKARKQRKNSRDFRSRCGKCNGCNKPDCGQCVECKRKKKYGGDGSSKQACIKRVCRNPQPTGSGRLRSAKRKSAEGGATTSAIATTTTAGTKPTQKPTQKAGNGNSKLSEVRTTGKVANKVTNKAPSKAATPSSPSSPTSTSQMSEKAAAITSPSPKMVTSKQTANASANATAKSKPKAPARAATTPKTKTNANKQNKQPNKKMPVAKTNENPPRKQQSAAARPYVHTTVTRTEITAPNMARDDRPQHSCTPRMSRSNSMAHDCNGDGMDDAHNGAINGVANAVNGSNQHTIQASRFRPSSLLDCHPPLPYTKAWGPYFQRLHRRQRIQTQQAEPSAVTTNENNSNNSHNGTATTTNHVASASNNNVSNNNGNTKQESTTSPTYMYGIQVPKTMPIGICAGCLKGDVPMPLAIPLPDLEPSNVASTSTPASEPSTPIQQVPKARGDTVILCDGCPREYHLKCCIPPLECVPEGTFLCFDCCPKGTAKFLEDYFVKHEAARDKMDDGNNFARALIQEDLDLTLQDRTAATNLVRERIRYPVSEIAHMHGKDPDAFIGRLVRMHSPFGNMYHDGRIVCAEITDDGDDTACLVTFPAGQNGRKTTVTKWMRLEEHSLAVSERVIWGKFLSHKKKHARHASSSHAKVTAPPSPPLSSQVPPPSSPPDTPQSSSSTITAESIGAIAPKSKAAIAATPHAAFATQGDDSVANDHSESNASIAQRKRKRGSATKQTLAHAAGRQEEDIAYRAAELMCWKPAVTWNRNARELVPVMELCTPDSGIIRYVDEGYEVDDPSGSKSQSSTQAQDRKMRSARRGRTVAPPPPASRKASKASTPTTSNSGSRNGKNEKTAGDATAMTKRTRLQHRPMTLILGQILASTEFKYLRIKTEVMDRPSPDFFDPDVREHLRNDPNFAMLQYQWQLFQVELSEVDRVRYYSRQLPLHEPFHPRALSLCRNEASLGALEFQRLAADDEDDEVADDDDNNNSSNNKRSKLNAAPHQEPQQIANIEPIPNILQGLDRLYMMQLMCGAVSHTRNHSGIEPSRDMAMSLQCELMPEINRVDGSMDLEYKSCIQSLLASS